MTLGSAEITYLPYQKTYLKGKYEAPMDYISPSIERIANSERDTQSNGVDGGANRIQHPEGPNGPSYSTRLNHHLYAIAETIANNKDAVRSGQLTAAYFESNRENLDHLILIRLYQRLMGEQMRWFHLDEMFTTIELPTLLYRMSYRNNPYAAQKVPRRGQYDTTKVEYDEIGFELEKYVVSYDIPIEDPLRALIDPVTPLQQNNAYSLAYLREKEALAALQELKYHYKKSATGTAKFEDTSAPTNNATQRISNPKTLTSGNFHSDNKTVNEIQYMRNEFLKAYDLVLTHFAMSPQTAMEIAQNTWTEPNTINNVEAYRTNGGIRQFPGLADATAVISLLVPDNVIYAACKPENALVRAEGPKITRSWEDNTRWTSQTATADFFQYKCCHEDLTISRKFGIIIDLQT